MRNFVLVVAFAATLACIVDSKPSETGYGAYEDLEEDQLDLEDEEFFNDLKEALNDEREQDETYRLFGDTMDSAKGYYNEIKKDPYVKTAIKGAKTLYNHSPLKDAVNVYKGAKSGYKLAAGKTNSYNKDMSLLKNAKSLYKDNKVRDMYNVYKGTKSGLSLAKYG